MRLGKWHRLLLLSTLFLVAASGLCWFVLHDLMEHEPDEWLHALLVVHGASSFGSAIAFGSLLPLHVPAGWRQRRNLVTGLTLGSAMAILIVSALVLYYGGEEARAWARLVHLWVGIPAILLAPLHMVLGRSRKSRKAGRAA